MKEKEKFELINCDPADIENAMLAVQASLRIEYDEAALQKVKTFGEYCDLVGATLDRARQDTGGCTGQQGFYKVRAAIGRVLDMDGRTISPSTKMEELFRWRGRRARMNGLQQELGIGMPMLMLKPRVGWWLFGFYLISFLAVFINWRYGLAAIGLAVIINWAAWRVASEICYKTVGDLAKRFSLSYYWRARRDAGTVNREEILSVIRGIFVRMLHIEPKLLRPDAAMF
jgi:hypothetical protein